MNLLLYVVKNTINLYVNTKSSKQFVFELIIKMLNDEVGKLDCLSNVCVFF